MNLENGSLSSDEGQPRPALKRLRSRAAEKSPTPVTVAAMQQLMDDLPEQVALLSEDCTIVAVNQSWTRAMAMYGYPGTEPGGNYREVCRETAATGYEPAIKVLAALGQMMAGKRNYWQLIFNGRGDWSANQFQLSFHRVMVGDQRFITITRFDLTEILELRRLKGDFSNSFIEGQVAERERMGRELHDSTSQHLAVAGLLLGRLKRELHAPHFSTLIEEIEEVMRETQKEIQSISYLACPPALERMRLADALKSLMEGFGRRTGLEAIFEIQGDILMMPETTELTLYRVAQEALANVQRHAHATRVRLLLSRRRSKISLWIADNGVGISSEILAGTGRIGVGLSSMRSRLTEIGGRLRIRRLSQGTAIMASFQLQSEP